MKTGTKVAAAAAAAAAVCSRMDKAAPLEAHVANAVAGDAAHRPFHVGRVAVLAAEDAMAPGARCMVHRSAAP